MSTVPNLQPQPARNFAQNFGVKAVIYGPPGVGKTPLINTAPAPLLCCVEPGMLSMRNSDIPTVAAFTAEAIDEFFRWAWGSAEAGRYQSWAFDSVSQMAEIILTKELKSNKDGRKAYGEMSRKMMEYLNGLYFWQGKHVILLAKQMVVTDGIDAGKKRPYFPGQDLNIKVPHLYDAILHYAPVQIPGVVGTQKALRTTDSYDVMARDRSGRLSEYEPPNLTELFNKIMKG